MLLLVWWLGRVLYSTHDDVIKWKHFPCHWPFVRGIHRSPVNSHTKASDTEIWCFVICPWINRWVNNHEASDLRRNRAHYHVIVMTYFQTMMWRVCLYSSTLLDPQHFYCHILFTGIQCGGPGFKFQLKMFICAIHKHICSHIRVLKLTMGLLRSMGQSRGGITNNNSLMPNDAYMCQ